MRFKPQRARRYCRVDFGVSPPGGFIAAAMDCAMMSATQWHRILITDLAAKRPALREPEVMRGRVRNLTAFSKHVNKREGTQRPSAALASDAAATI